MDQNGNASPRRMSRLDRIRFAQQFFRFSYQIGTPISFGLGAGSRVNPALVVFGEHRLTHVDLELDQKEFATCGALLERLAYRVLALELNAALEEKFGDWKTRVSHSDELIRDASIVIWIIRNAVAHDVIEPIWRIDDLKWQDLDIVIEGILKFSTKGLNGRPLKRMDFGGPIALFRLSEKLLERLE